MEITVYRSAVRVSIDKSGQVIDIMLTVDVIAVGNTAPGYVAGVYPRKLRVLFVVVIDDAVLYCWNTASGTADALVDILDNCIVTNRCTAGWTYKIDTIVGIIGSTA
jgi:hypothetical protein